MTNNDAAAWREISPYLDDALQRDEAARAAWLHELDASHPDIAARVRELLNEHALLTKNQFLSTDTASLLHSTSLTGLQLGAYTLTLPLGSGGAGSVWLARRSDGRFEGKVAVKLLNSALVGRPAGKRFVREGSLLAKLDHANIAHLIDAGIAPGGQPYLVLEYVEGERIDRYCEQHGLDVEGRLRLFLDVLAAVEHAHSHLIVHRDLKPSNIFVTHTGVVKLLDFGVAALLAAREDDAPELTREAEAGLTPEYAAPEQLLGMPVTTATDVYALGLVLFVLLAGRHPASPEGKSAAELMRLTLETETPPPSHVASDVQRGRVLRGDLDNIIAKALKKDPADRYLTASAFAQDLRHFLAQEPVSARPDSLTYRAGKFVRRHRGGLATGLLTAIALIATASFALLQMYQARGQRDQALEQSKIAEGYSSVITSLLSQVGPGGRALEPHELLERAVVEVEKRYADDPGARVSMLVRISGRYYDLRDTNKEYEMLVKAEGIARRQGDPEMLLNVQCNTVETDIAAGRKAEALLRLEEARMLLAASPDASPGLRADCLRSEAEFARADDNLPAAIAHYERARKVLEDDGRTWGNRYSGVMSGLAAYNSAYGDLVSAHRYRLACATLDQRYGRRDSLPGLIGQAGLANSFYLMGQVHKGVTMTQQALRDWNDLPGSPPLNPSIAYRYGEMLSRTGRHDEALELIRGAIDSSSAGGNKTLAGSVRLGLARALLRAQQIDAADTAQSEALATLQQTDSPHSAEIIEALRVRAEIRLVQGRVDEAAAAADDAMTRLNSPGVALAPTRARVLETRAQIALARGRPADAIRDANAAAQLFTKNCIAPDESADVGEALLIRARAEAAAGDQIASRSTTSRANQILQRALNH